MSGQEAGPAELFRGRYALEVTEASGEGILIDLLSGSVFQLNPSAATICQALIDASTVDEAVRRLPTRLDVSTDVATTLVASVIKDLALPRIRELPPDVFVYRSDGNGLYSLHEGDRRVFAIDSRAKTFQVFGSYRSEGTLAAYVRAVVPKLLGLLDRPILHAAAVELGARLIAICGASGAGKTTTGRAFQKAGAPLFSEDLVILDVDGARVAAHLHGEKAARVWCADTAKAFGVAPDVALSYESLGDLVLGQTRALDAIWFVDSARRVGDGLAIRPVSKTGALTLLLGNGFLATAEPSQWRRFLSRSANLARSVAVFEATMPDGVNLLAVAAKSYAVNSAS